MKWFGKIGFYITEEVVKNGIGTGVFKARITEVPYRGDLIKDYRTQDNSSTGANENIHINNTVSIISDRFLDEHLMDIKYLTFKGYKFKVRAFTQVYPRLELQFGGLYNNDQT